MAKDIGVTKTSRFSYSGERQFVISSRLSGLLEPIDCCDLMYIMRQLTKKVNPRSLDYIVGLDSSGIIPSMAASMITGLPLILAYKMDLDDKNPLIRNKIRFNEPGSPNPSIYVYNLPEESDVLVIDDEIRTGDTIINCIDSLVKAGNSVKGVIVPVESTRFGAREKLAKMGYELISYVKHDL